MNTIHRIKTTLLPCVAALALLTLSAAHAATVSKADYKTGKDSISATYKTDKAACASMTANAKDICVEEAKAKEKVAKAELEYGYTGKAKDQTKVLQARADGAYAVAKERCDDKAGNDKDVCVKEAKAAQVKAKADAKTGKQVAEARSDGAKDKSDADYKVAKEKCDAMAGDPKTACMNAAKARFGKS